MTLTNNVLPPPLVDRHLHLEGALDPCWVRAAALRQGIPIPPVLEAFWRGNGSGFQAFIESFLFVCRFLDSAEAVREALVCALDRLPPTTPGHMRGMDLWISPHWLVRERRQISLDALWQGLEEGLAVAAQRQICVAVVVEAVNHLGPKHGHEVLDLVAADLPPWVRGFSTGGLERVPFREWAPVFQRARKLGLRIAAHAGENGPASQVREAVLEGGAERLIHAFRAGEDPALLELLAERRIPVDVCLSSNRILVPDGATHPLPRFLAAGVRCGLGTDDPGIMACDLATEWALAHRLGLPEEALQRLRQQSAEDAWSLQIRE